MTITAHQGPQIAYGQGSSLDYNPELGPSLFWGNSGLLDPRAQSTYNPGQNFGALTAGWGDFSAMTLNVIPQTKSATIISTAAHITGGTALTLASANASGIAVGVNAPLLGSVSGASLVNALCLDPAFASMTASVTSGSNVLTVTVVAAPGTVALSNQVIQGMVLTDSTTAANIPTGTTIIGYGTGSGGIGTYFMSANATATASGDTVTGLFTGPQNAVPFGSAGTIQLYNPIAMCARAVAITSTTSQVAGIVFTITGADVYGYAMTETITTSGTSATTTNGVKAWKYIQSITPSGTDGTGSYSVGTQDVFGFPLRTDFFTGIAGLSLDTAIYYNGAAVTSSTGYTAAVVTTPTATTGDVRGTYALQTASNAVRQLILNQTPNVAAMGAGTLGVGLFGQSQYTTI